MYDMPSADDYQLVRIGQWVFWLLKGALETSTVESLAAIVDRLPHSRHPQTLPFAWPPKTDTSQFFLKVFHRRRGWAQIKDLLRHPKARRFWRQGMALSASGFNVPLTVLFGERRRWGLSERSLVLTDRIDGTPAPAFLSALAYSVSDHAQVKSKRRALTQLGQLIRHFHDLGFVHGDLVATNIFVAQSADAPVFYFMDNDRTQHYPAWMTMSLRKRNLVQLNRMPLAHITLQDRMRFLRSYLKVERIGKAHRAFAVWLERRTRQRRSEVDGVDATGSFRKLMASRR
jgi:hypothetical protein